MKLNLICVISCTTNKKRKIWTLEVFRFFKSLKNIVFSNQFSSPGKTLMMWN